MSDVDDATWMAPGPRRDEVEEWPCGWCCASGEAGHRADCPSWTDDLAMRDHVKGDYEPDGLCLVCDECDGEEGHTDPHDCGHDQ